MKYQVGDIIVLISDTSRRYLVVGANPIRKEYRLVNMKTNCAFDRPSTIIDFCTRLDMVEDEEEII